MTETLLIFDVDGTLVDSQAMICAAMERAFRAHGLCAPLPAEIRGIIGLSLETAVARLCGAMPDAPIGLMVEAYKAAFFDLRASTGRHEPLFPGALDVLDALAGRGDVVLGLATGKSRRGVRAVLDLHGLHGRFATVQTADGNPSKPDPGMVLAAMAETGIGPDRTLVVGDTTFDIEMARAAGARALGVSWGYYPPPALLAAGAEALLDSYDDLLPAFGALFPEPAPA